MKRMRLLPVLFVALIGGAALSTSAFAQWHRGGPRIGIGLNFGFPLYAPYYAPVPYYYPPPVYYPPAVVAPAPQVYVEPGQTAPQLALSQPQGFWYYCADSKGYYPYVKDCPGGWQRVAPQPG